MACCASQRGKNRYLTVAGASDYPTYQTVLSARGRNVRGRSTCARRDAALIKPLLPHRDFSVYFPRSSTNTYNSFVINFISFMKTFLFLIEKIKIKKFSILIECISFRNKSMHLIIISVKIYRNLSDLSFQHNCGKIVPTIFSL